MKLTDVTGALKAYRAATKKETAPPDVVASRVRVCLTCPQRKRTQGISRVSKYLADLARLNNADKNISDFSCNICGCSLLLLTSALPENLHVDSEVQKTKREKTNCWMK